MNKMSENELRQILLDIFKAQDVLNSKINRDWKSAGRLKTQDFFLAASQEISEFQESLGAYKWWSNTPISHENSVNCVMELIDTFHFGISADIAHKGIEYSVKDWMEAIQQPYIWDFEGFGLIANPTNDTLIMQIAKMLQAGCLTAEDAFPRKIFLQLWVHGMGESIESLYLYYTGKSVLNTFRQDNGYKEGRYKKVWVDGREDNAHLMEWLITHKMDGPLAKENIRAWLSEAYAENAFDLKS